MTTGFGKKFKKILKLRVYDRIAFKVAALQNKKAPYAEKA